jgi:hypothetical protein
VHVTNSGVVATWYFKQRSMPRHPTLGSLKRAITTSFGSICLGSLVVALVQLLHSLVEEARRNQDAGSFSACIYCCISCCMGYIEMLVELFNHWAFVQVAVYGKDFKTAAKDTWQLVQSRGLSGLVNMNLTSQAVSLGMIVGAVISAAVVALLAYSPVYHEPTHAGHHLSPEARQVYSAMYGGTIAFSALCSLIFTGTVSSVITSGVTTLFVCWAEDPVALQESNAALHARFAEISDLFLRDHPYYGGAARADPESGWDPESGAPYGRRPPPAYQAPPSPPAPSEPPAEAPPAAAPASRALPLE